MNVAESSDIPAIMTIPKENDLHTEYISDKVENFYLSCNSEDLVGSSEGYILT